jgi:SAM-dependent methyltransferase
VRTKGARSRFSGLSGWPLVTAALYSEPNRFAVRDRSLPGERLDDSRLDGMSELTDEAWLHMLCRGGIVPGIGSLPQMPDEVLQVNTVGQSGIGALREAWQFAATCLAWFRTSPCFSRDDKVLLDFGTGWGRIARCFLREFHSNSVIGVDIDPELIAICQQTFPGPRFITCHPPPPLELADASADFIVGYSVFSHLSETSCKAWVEEFARILKPGGMAALTTSGRWFFDFARSLGEQSSDSYATALSRMFPDFEAAKAKYDRGEFVHSNAHGVTGGGVRDGSFYGETFIPARYAKEAYEDHLHLREFLEGEGHPILLFERRG